jgi:threonine/homoserine/homoserine lactone efflux protein
MPQRLNLVPPALFLVAVVACVGAVHASHLGSAAATAGGVAVAVLAWAAIVVWVVRADRRARWGEFEAGFRSHVAALEADPSS